MRRLPCVLAALLLALPAAAQQAAPAPSSPQSAAPAEAAPAAPPAAGDDRPATQAEVKALAEEVRRLKLEMSVPEAVTFGSYQGMGMGASKVHYQPKGLSIGGYGELVYTNYTDDRADFAEVLRLVLYVGYRFSDTIVFNSEIEFEHGAKEIGIELAYFDFLLMEPLKLRVGNVLLPVGFLNENHEPIFFYGVYRPLVDRYIIPTTWNQNGLGIYGDVGPLRYKAYLVTGMDVFGGEGPLEASTWVRNARTGAFGPARTWAGVGSVNVDVGPATFGGSFYGGNAGQGYKDTTGATISPWILIGEVHALVAWKGLTARGIMAFGSLSQAGTVSEILGKAPDEYIGSSSWGGYVEAGFDVLTLVGSSMSLSPFLRFEAFNTQSAVQGAGVLNPAFDRRVITTGIDFKPIPQVAVKANWQQVSNMASQNLQQWDLGLGFVY
ncbi:MAG TPA: hypothetical protein VFM53_01040 [Anaeromyxobacteraceae bacterium]|nr:hypothetical protein [Anaeromyxobacteraceae bacterium]